MVQTWSNMMKHVYIDLKSPLQLGVACKSEGSAWLFPPSLCLQLLEAYLMSPEASQSHRQMPFPEPPSPRREKLNEVKQRFHSVPYSMIFHVFIETFMRKLWVRYGQVGPVWHSNRKMIVQVMPREPLSCTFSLNVLLCPASICFLLTSKSNSQGEKKQQRGRGHVHLADSPAQRSDCIPFQKIVKLGVHCWPVQIPPWCL